MFHLLGISEYLRTVVSKTEVVPLAPTCIIYEGETISKEIDHLLQTTCYAESKQGVEAESSKEGAL